MLLKVVGKVNWPNEALAYVYIEISDEKSKSGFKAKMIKKKKAIDLKKRQNKEEIEEAVFILNPVWRPWA